MKRFAKIPAALLIIFLTATVCSAQERIPLPDKKARDSYSLGYEFGSNLKAQEVALDEDVLIIAIREALRGKEPAMKIDEINDDLKQLRKEVLIRYNLRRNAFAEKNKKDGEDFLAANSKKSGVVTLPSGLQYKVLKEGSGPRPQARDLVKVIYRGTLQNGMEFDSSGAGGGPALVKVNGMIPAWVEALQMMKTGSEWRLFVPAELGYGTRQYGKVPPNSALVFDLKLLSVEKDPGQPK